jgi:flagellar motor switch protein FliG
MAEIAKERRKVSGIDKAAIIMLSLPEDQVAELFSRLDPEEIKEITQSMVSLGTVKANTVESMFVEFVNEMSSTGSLVGSIESTERLLARVLNSDQVSNIMEEIRGPAGRTVWDKLSNVNEDLLASYLKNEYPQTIAVVLSRIKPQNAAKILTSLPETITSEILNRLLRMEPVKKEVMEDIENNLRVEFMSNLARGVKRDNHEVVAELFNHMDKHSETKFFKSLEAINQESAEKVRSLMFTFEDLINLDNNSVQILLKSLDKNKIALALKGTDEDVKDLFFSNMSARAAKLLEEEMQMMGMVRLRDVEDAQSYVVQTAKTLANEGTIFISTSKEEGDRLVE